MSLIQLGLNIWAASQVLGLAVFAVALLGGVLGMAERLCEAITKWENEREIGTRKNNR